MPACCIKSCKNRSEKGFRLFRMPTEHKRRRIWLEFIKRPDLPERGVICEAHFSEGQFASNRQDERRLLKHCAVPTLLGPKCEQDVVSEASQINCENTGIQGPDVSYQKILKEEPLDLEAAIELNCENSNNQIDDSNMQESTDVIIDLLKKRVKALLQEKRILRKKLVRRDENFQQTFNEDQLKYLEVGTHRGFKWSDQTIEKAMQLYCSCGVKGYEAIRAQNLPYPSIRTIQERERLQMLEKDIVDNVVNNSISKVKCFTPTEEHGILLSDELIIKEEIE